MRKGCILLCLLLALLLCGCGRTAEEPAAAPEEPAAAETPAPTPDARLTQESLDLSGQGAEALASIDDYPALRTVELGKNGFTASELVPVVLAHPDIEFHYRFALGGKMVRLDDTELDLSRSSLQSVEELADWAPAMPALREIKLGSGSYSLDEPAEGEEPSLSWDTIGRLREAAPQAHLDYSFTLFKKPFTLDSESMDLNHIAMDDEGELVKAVTACMPNLRWLDMDFCEVSDERMAEIRDSLPDCEVVWRVWFGNGRYGGYSVRTNVERILASNPDKAGELTPETTKALMYCTKVRYLDLGHNDQMTDISFVSYMPDLEVAVLAMGGFKDISPLANCPKLEYLEIQTAAVSDLRPLSGLKNLRHLNLCYSFALTDITPLYELTDLQRLWLGKYDPVPEEQIREMKRRAPQCEIELETDDPSANGWRYLGQDDAGNVIPAPRYEQLRQQFQYILAPLCYSYIENDPLYYPHP